ncbi:hypothetical protein BMR1_03g01350 [Babesia microti strain RI]|uniref:Uncharacterized protein n=1 Tax=Babesia microti (strain RI) TaxID=1133968 RepID=A0A0K3AMA4_BABMR|nr:hypothetical protein BMR1_03g01350 [Babesia microti strain RI]CTQ40869.1 hypothetical protein BMR1_03g01350 [Babesia microti strain RI]|eukprot:XP_012648880.1 hypothetical protein BMR1_03g01350 [Babesia microti strain RI]
MRESFALVSCLALGLCINVEARGLGNNSDESGIGDISEHNTLNNRVESSDASDQIITETNDSKNNASLFSVSTKVELGSPLMVATPFGCAILAQPSDKQAPVENDPLPNVKGEWLSFDFTLSDLSDCTEVTDAILAQLRHQLLSQYPSSTTESPISLHSSSRNASNDENYNFSNALSPNERDVEFREKLSVTMHPTTLDNVYVLRFILLDEPHPLAESNIVKALSALNGDFGDDSSLNGSEDRSNNSNNAQDFDNMSEMSASGIGKEIDLSKKILEELSSSKSESVECMSLAATEKDCKTYSKCDILRLDGKDVCFVSPRTAFWLLETKCALQSKSALLGVAKDLTSAGMLTEENYQTLRSSFDVDHICSTITHSYFANSKRLSSVIPPKAFEL